MCSYTTTIHMSPVPVVRNPSVALREECKFVNRNVQHSTCYRYLICLPVLADCSLENHHRTQPPVDQNYYFPNKKANSSSWVNAGTFEFGLPPPSPVEPLKFTTCCLPTIASKLRFSKAGDNQVEDDVFGDVFDESRPRWRGLVRRDFGQWCRMAA